MDRGGTPLRELATPIGVTRPNHYEVTAPNQVIDVAHYLNGRFANKGVAYRSTSGAATTVTMLIPMIGGGSLGTPIPTRRFPYSRNYSPMYIAFRYIAWLPEANGGLGQLVSGPLSRVVKVSHLRFPFRYEFGAYSSFGPCASISPYFSNTELGCWFETRLP